MTTLNDLKIKYAGKPVTSDAINRAIADYTDQAEAVMISGMSSTAPQSNLARYAKKSGWTRWTHYNGARAGRNWNDGYYNVMVKLA